MERNRGSVSVAKEQASSDADRRVLRTVVAAGLLLAAGCSPSPKPQRVLPTPHIVEVLLPPWKPLPAEWPPAATFLNVDCRPGAPVSRQWPGHIGEFTTGILDGRCVIDGPGSLVAIHEQPASDARLVTFLPNGFFVRLDCQVSGGAVRDTRTDMVNNQWFGVTFRNPISGQDEQGFASAASQGQITAPLTNEVPQC